MVDQININTPGGIKPAGPAGGGLDIAKTPQIEPSGPSFKDILMGKINEVNDLILNKDAAVAALATGKTDNVSEVLIQVEKADQAFNALMQIRNKLVEAWQEIERMQI
jgi:flagellar hook-basal body complex protein FliE